MGKISYEVVKERERAFRLESVVKRAVNVVKTYEKTIDELKEEVNELKKELASKKNSDNSANLSVKEFRNKIRKLIHPDKFQDASIKNVMNIIFAEIERIFDES